MFMLGGFVDCLITMFMLEGFTTQVMGTASALSKSAQKRND
jgi:hypothetical protein